MKFIMLLALLCAWLTPALHAQSTWNGLKFGMTPAQASKQLNGKVKEQTSQGLRP